MDTHQIMSLPVLRIGVTGLNGRMGQMLALSIASSSEAILAGGTSRSPTGNSSCPCFQSIDELAAVSDLIIDFTHVSTVINHARTLEKAGKAWVLGTTGLSEREQAAVNQAATHIPVVQAANFSPGVTLALSLAKKMGAALPASLYDAEIVEMHHRQKVDAPSGTALAIGEAVAEGRGVRLADVRESGRDGHTGPRGDNAIGFAALRGGQIVGEHTLLFTSGTEQISLTHKAFDRRIFADGAVRAALWLREQPAGLYGMEDVLGL